MVRDVSIPLVRLHVGEQGLAVRPTNPGGILQMVPELFIPWHDVSKAERVRGPIIRFPGVRIFAQKAEGPIVFWTFAPEEVLRAMERHGVVVDRIVHRVPLLGP